MKVYCVKENVRNFFVLSLNRVATTTIDILVRKMLYLCKNYSTYANDYFILDRLKKDINVVFFIEFESSLIYNCYKVL